MPSLDTNIILKEKENRKELEKFFLCVLDSACHDGNIKKPNFFRPLLLVIIKSTEVETTRDWAIDLSLENNPNEEELKAIIDFGDKEYQETAAMLLEKMKEKFFLLKMLKVVYDSLEKDTALQEKIDNFGQKIKQDLKGRLGESIKKILFPKK